MSCDCCDNALEHRIRYILNHEANAPHGMAMKRTVILSELEEAIDEFEHDNMKRRDNQRTIRELSEARRAAQEKTG